MTTFSATQSVTARLQTTQADATALTRPAAKVVKAETPPQQFEAFVLQSFIQSMMPNDASSVYGEGTAGSVWKSMMAEKIAKEIAENGGIGIAKMIAQKPGGPAPAALPRDAAAAKLLDLQMSGAGSGVSLAPATPISALDVGSTERNELTDLG